VVVVTVRLPIVAEQVTEKAAVVVPPAGTVTVWEVPPLTVQLLGTPLRVTVWLAALSPGTVTLLLMPIAWAVPPSMANVYPVGGFEPVVLVVTVRLPVVAEQVTEKAAVAVPPAGTVTVWDVPPLTVQLLGTPLKVTVWLPAPSPEMMTLLLMPMAWAVPPSTANA
jgi:hypothetical protein